MSQRVDPRTGRRPTTSVKVLGDPPKLKDARWTALPSTGTASKV